MEKAKARMILVFIMRIPEMAVMSHGTQATMPVYKAGEEMRRQVLNIAKEVFGG